MTDEIFNPAAHGAEWVGRDRVRVDGVVMPLVDFMASLEVDQTGVTEPVYLPEISKNVYTGGTAS